MLGLNSSGQFLVRFGTDFQFLSSDYEITQMTWMKDAEVFYRQLDLEIKTIVARQEIVTKSFDGQTLFNPDVSPNP